MIIRKNIGSTHFQLVTICHRFITFLFQPLFKFSPISLWVCAVGQDSHHINNREIPFLLLIIPNGPHFLFLEKLYSLFFYHNLEISF